MKRDILKLKILDLVYSSQEHDWIQIRNNEKLQIIERLWGTQFSGIELSEEVLNRFWSDFMPKYYSEYIMKFEYIDEDNGKKLFSFYGEYSKENVPPIVKTNMFGGEEGMLQYFPDSEVFERSYCYQKGNKVYFKYVHELQSLLDNYKIGRSLYGNMIGHLAVNIDWE